MVVRLCQLATPAVVASSCRAAAIRATKRTPGSSRTTSASRRSHRSRAGIRGACPDLHRRCDTLPPGSSGRRRNSDRAAARNVKPRLRMTSLYFYRQLAELSGRRHRQPQRAHDRLLHQVRRRRRGRPADRPPAQERSAGDRDRSSACRSDRRQGAERGLVGRARPTKTRWGSATPTSSAT